MACTTFRSAPPVERLEAVTRQVRRLLAGERLAPSAAGEHRPLRLGPEPAPHVWWVAFYLTSMGPLYPRTLRRLGHGAAVDDVLAANPTGRTTEVPASAEGLLDELTIRGDSTAARAALDRWYAAGAGLPVLALSPNRPVDELDHVLESLRPS
jgi:hypothetical protein